MHSTVERDGRGRSAQQRAGRECEAGWGGAGWVWLSQLRLVNFRNFRALRLEPQPGVLLFSGHNGQGKTNLLESVYVLATTRSPRTSVERELLSWRAPEDADLAAVTPPFARLEARVRRLSGETHLELTFEGERSGNANGPGAVTRDIKVNGLATRAAGLVGQLPVVYFSPADVDLAGGSPSGRRQYLNLANSQASPSHLRALQRYNRVLLQRNQVLRLVRERRQLATALEPWTEQMVSWGAQILHQRLTMLREMNARIADIFRDLAGSTEGLEVVYRSTVCETPHDPESVAALQQAYKRQQTSIATREIEQAVSLVGPHRDDFTFVLDGVDLNTYGSRGQQRLAVLALKLAEADWMRAAIGEIPVVLLDDVLSELDPQRRAYVLQRVAEPEPSRTRQVWITTTETDLLAADSALATAQHYTIEAGQVHAVSMRE
ncbi:MAG: DNA replication/repair protein RecF [Chloroflexi bacterium]|nr:DNA replication/repair protein RecF [Chloroflexota bacterium]